MALGYIQRTGRKGSQDQTSCYYHDQYPLSVMFKVMYWDLHVNSFTCFAFNSQIWPNDLFKIIQSSEQSK
jgi:hypothetical protein